MFAFTRYSYASLCFSRLHSFRYFLITSLVYLVGFRRPCWGIRVLRRCHLATNPSFSHVPTSRSLYSCGISRMRACSCLILFLPSLVAVRVTLIPCVIYKHGCHVLGCLKPHINVETSSSSSTHCYWYLFTDKGREGFALPGLLAQVGQIDTSVQETFSWDTLWRLRIIELPQPECATSLRIVLCSAKLIGVCFPERSETL